MTSRSPALAPSFTSDSDYIRVVERKTVDGEACQLPWVFGYAPFPLHLGPMPSEFFPLNCHKFVAHNAPHSWGGAQVSLPFACEMGRLANLTNKDYPLLAALAMLLHNDVDVVPSSSARLQNPVTGLPARWARWHKQLTVQPSGQGSNIVVIYSTLISPRLFLQSIT
jgi:hypothetical protein